MTLAWQSKAWEDYIEWQKTDKNIAKKINELIRECLRTPTVGKGNPEMLRHNLSGYWSRRINEEHRLVYKIEDDFIIIIQCKFHYSK